MNDEITFFQIELSPENNIFYHFCQQKRREIERLRDEGFFEISGGRAIVDFKSGGAVDRVIRVLYGKNKEENNVGLPGL